MKNNRTTPILSNEFAKTPLSVDANIKTTEKMRTDNFCILLLNTDALFRIKMPKTAPRNIYCRYGNNGNIEPYLYEIYDTKKIFDEAPHSIGVIKGVRSKTIIELIKNNGTLGILIFSETIAKMTIIINPNPIRCNASTVKNVSHCELLTFAKLNNLIVGYRNK
jgi:hypothetical protein